MGIWVLENQLHMYLSSKYSNIQVSIFIYVESHKDAIRELIFYPDFHIHLNLPLSKCTFILIVRVLDITS